MKKIILIICSLLFSFSVFANFEINIQSKIEEKKTIVVSSMKNPALQDEIVRLLSIYPNLKINNSDNNCSNINLNLNTGYYCAEIKDLNGNSFAVNIYEKMKSKTIKEFNLSLSEVSGDYNLMAKNFGNIIYKTIFNKDSVFNNKLAYVERKDLGSKKVYNLKITDFEGKNQRVLVASNHPILSISWSDDNSKIAYVSYQSVRPNVFVYDFNTRKNKKITSFKGVNAFPSWSPDGRYLAMSLSKDGTSDLYIYDFFNDKIKKLTSFNYDATEPLWLSKNDIIFTSNKSGNPLLYKLNINTKKQTKVNSNFNYITNPRTSSKREKIYSIFSQGRRSGILETIVFNNKERVLVEDSYAESPTISSGGDIVMYSTKFGKNNILRAIDLNGKIVYEIKSNNTSLKEPSYSN